jgi:hypothetical protein
MTNQTGRKSFTEWAGSERLGDMLRGAIVSNAILYLVGVLTGAPSSFLKAADIWIVLCFLILVVHGLAARASRRRQQPASPSS